MQQATRHREDSHADSYTTRRDVTVPIHASAQPAPLDPPVSAYSHTASGRTDQQFWGEATWLNPLSGLNLDRTSAGR